MKTPFAEKNLRRLVIDDNASSRQILRHQIFAGKLQTASAASGHEALRVLCATATEGHAVFAAPGRRVCARNSQTRAFCPPRTTP